MDILERLAAAAIVPVVVLDSVSDAVPTARAMLEGGIDVMEIEPLPADSPLMHLVHPERLLFSPHIAWYSHEARARLAHEMAENIRKGW